ncbi:MAG: hypothetical protein ACYC43_06235 [Burkholderiales bacterium]
MANFIGIRTVEKNNDFLIEFIKGKETASERAAKLSGAAAAVVSTSGLSVIADDAKSDIEAYFSIAEDKVGQL